jgi:hypothetical protein
MIGAAAFMPDSSLVPELSWIGPFLRKPPKGWRRIEEWWTANGAGWRSSTGLAVMLSGAVELDGRRWVHVSTSRRDRMPSYEDLAVVKRLFIGEERRAIQVFVPHTEHVNRHQFCLHLWCCVDGDGLPDFRSSGEV